MPEVIPDFYNEVSKEIVDKANNLQPNVNYEISIPGRNPSKLTTHRQILPTDLTASNLWTLLNAAIPIYDRIGPFTPPEGTSFGIFVGDAAKVKILPMQNNVLLAQFNVGGKMVSCVLRVDEKTPNMQGDVEASIPELPFLVESETVKRAYDTGVVEEKSEALVSAARTLATICPDGKHTISIQEYLPGHSIKENKEGKYAVLSSPFDSLPFVGDAKSEETFPLTENGYQGIVSALRRKVSNYCFDNGAYNIDDSSSSGLVPSNIMIVSKLEGMTYPQELSVSIRMAGRDFLAMPMDIPVYKK
jgi:hypothetical protein